MSGIQKPRTRRRGVSKYLQWSSDLLCLVVEVQNPHAPLETVVITSSVMQYLCKYAL